MMHPAPITVANESQVYTYIRKKTVINQRCRVIGAVVLPVGSVLFVTMTLVALLGVCYMMEATATAALFDAIPQFGVFWETVEAALLHRSPYWFVNGLMWSVFVFVPPMAVSGLLSLVITLVYHPKPPVVTVASTPRERAAQLHRLARNIPKVPALANDEAMIAALIGSLVFLLPFGALSIYNVVVGDAIYLFGNLVWMIGGLLTGGISAVVGYYLLMMVFLFINSIWYARGWFNHGLVRETEAYCLSFEPQKAQKCETVCSQLTASWSTDPQQEHDDYRKRLHEWATSDDDFDFTGYGDGI